MQFQFLQPVHRHCYPNKSLLFGNLHNEKIKFAILDLFVHSTCCDVFLLAVLVTDTDYIFDIYMTLLKHSLGSITRVTVNDNMQYVYAKQTKTISCCINKKLWVFKNLDSKTKQFKIEAKH